MGPLEGIKVIEIPNIGPMQFADMLLSDLGAETSAQDAEPAEGTPVGGDEFHTPIVRRDR